MGIFKESQHHQAPAGGDRRGDVPSELIELPGNGVSALDTARAEPAELEVLLRHLLPLARSGMTVPFDLTRPDLVPRSGQGAGLCLWIDQLAVNSPLSAGWFTHHGTHHIGHQHCRDR
ncbi:hypothetical protein OG698_00140 [Streptomyces sp. NBC_01003]|uniref:hypothetical protein n=1 Tax=Streptomyces sp. NBC_01003 TaxID=2903714 RepID=UPI00386E59E1|nr:hypothetical protein OG698_00140 [Streptomyces sp. NBC_01003]